MTGSDLDLEMDLNDLSQQEWLGRLDELGDEHGFFEQLGSKHFALSFDAGPRLLVTFETIENARKNPTATPRGFDFVTRNGWSLLAFLSDGETWFRDAPVYRAMDRLTDEGFFDEFEQVLFLGEGSGGYAAAAYSVASPNARVLALRPQATLDPAIAGWDRRYIRDRRRDFSSRYGYAPEMVDAANRAYILFDPAQISDAMHASLFHDVNVTLLRCPLVGGRIEQMFDLLQITGPLVDAAMDGTLNRQTFARLWRARRQSAAYLRSLLRKTELAGRPRLVQQICRYGLKTRDKALFARKLAEMGLTEDQPTATAAAE
ncbi:MAG: hypothetical protein NTX73_04685 [Rhodobacterales bacterium]|nr:hypothetical protein [Rhodobacterales bacterium]